MEEPYITKMGKLEASRKQGKKPTKSKKSKKPEPLTEEQLEKLPKLPKDWKWVSHSEIATVNPPKPDGNELLEISFLPMPAVEEETGRYSLSETRKLGEVRKGYTGFIEGDVIFAKITPCMENGKVAYLEKLVNGIGFGSTEFHVSRPTSSVFGKYLFHYLVQQTFRKQAKRNMTGSAGQLRVPSSYFAGQPFPLAPLPEQRAIISKIEQLFSELDNGISNLKLAQEQLKVYRQAVLKKAFEGELTKKWREQQTDLPDAKDLLEQIRKEREKVAKASGGKVKDVESLTDTELADLPEVSDRWKWVKLQELCNLIGGVTKGRKLEGKKTVSLPYLRVANVQDGYLDLSEIKFIDALEGDLEKYRLIEGDILYTEGGDKDKLGRGTIWKGQIENCIHQNHIFRARPYSSNLVSSYIGYFSQTQTAKRYFFKNAKQTVNLASINLTVLSNLPFPLCSLPEQQAIVQEIETRLSVCDKIEQDIQTNLEKAEALRQSILKKAFEGKLLNERELTEVRGAEDWEPAEVLLERIKAERNNKG